MIECNVVKDDENKEANTARVEASKNSASLAPALDLRSTYHGSSGFPRFGHALHSTPFRSMSISPPLRAAARSVYRDLWRASAATFAGAIGSS